MLAFLVSLILVFFFCPYKCHFKCELRKWAYKKSDVLPGFNLADLRFKAASSAPLDHVSYD